MQNASKTIPASKARLWIMLTPRIGKKETNKGSIAQWMAQATDVVIPNASQFILNFIKEGKAIKKATLLQNYFNHSFVSLKIILSSVTLPFKREELCQKRRCFTQVFLWY